MVWTEAKACIASQDYDKAVKLLEQALRIDPDLGDLEDDLAFCCSRVGDHVRAVDHSLRAIAKNPTEPRFYSNLAARYLRQSETAEAEFWGKKAMALQPSFKSAQQLMRTLDQYGPERKPEEPELYSRCLRAVMESPVLVDAIFDLHRPGRWPTSAEEADAAVQIDRALGGTGKSDSSQARDVRARSGDLLQYLSYEPRWSAALRDDARARFPIREFAFDFEIPDGFQQKSGWYFRWERRKLKLLAKLAPPGRRLPAITIHFPQKTLERYPWQQAISGNYFMWFSKGTRLASRYVRVAGTVQYEISYAIGDDPWVELTTGRVTSLQRIGIPLVVSGEREYRLMAAAERLEDVRAAFDHFLQSLN